MVFLLHAVPFLLMQPVLFRSYSGLAKQGAGGLWMLALVALVGGVFGTLSIVKALFLVNFNQLSVVVLLQKLQPIFAILLAAWVLREKITSRFLVWAGVAIMGGYLLTFGFRSPDFGSGDRPTGAALYAILAAASFGAATVLGKKLLGALNFWEATFGRYGMTTLITAGLLVVTGLGLPLSDVRPEHWLTILVIGVTTGSGALFLYYWGLQRVRAMTATICELCLPLSAVLFDYIVNGSRLSVVQLVGAVLMVGAITRVSAAQSAQNPQRDS